MKVKETDSERGRSTMAWFTSFSGETVQAMVEPLFSHHANLQASFSPAVRCRPFKIWGGENDSSKHR